MVRSSKSYRNILYTYRHSVEFDTNKRISFNLFNLDVM